MIKVYRQAGNILRMGNTVAARNLLGNGIAHDGVNDTIDFSPLAASEFTSDDAFSFEFWIKLGGAIPGQFNNALISNRATGGADSLQISRTAGNNGTLRLQLDSAGTSYRWTLNQGTPDGLHHVICARSSDRSTVRFYVDNVNKALTGTTIPAGRSLFTTSGYYTGINGIGGREVCNHTYYLFRIFNKELSASEVSDLYNFNVPASAVNNVVQETLFNQNRGNEVSSNIGASATGSGFSNTNNYGGDGTTAAWRNPKGGVAI